MKILHNQPLNEEEKQYYGRIYPFSNESIRSYYKYYDLKGKNALCITSSGDHIIYASLNGAQEIDAFDKNRLCKYYSALKIATILAYNEKEFYNIFCQKNKRLLSRKIDIEHIKDFISEECYIFWEQITKEKVFRNNDTLFRKDGLWGNKRPNLDYNSLKVALSNSKINYYDMSAKEFSTYTNKKYDAIFLSNIVEREWTDYSKSNLLDSYIKLLNENGVLYDYYISRMYTPQYAKKESLEQNIGKCLVYRNLTK